MRTTRLRAALAAGLLAASAFGVASCAGSSGPVAAPTTAAVDVPESAAEECARPPAAPRSVSTFTAAPSPDSVARRRLTATLRTTCGPIEIELYADKAPQTVASFEQLAGAGYWVDSPCHRLTTSGIHVLQCGDPTGTGRGSGPGYSFGIENAPADGRYPAGTVAMARTQRPDSNGGQFFIVHADTVLPVDSGGYTIFGRVTSGSDVLQKVARAGVEGGGGDGAPAQPISIVDVTVHERKS